jgi:hypothetical protein
VLLALGAWLVLRRFRGPVLLVGLAVGTVAGSVIAAHFGHQIGLTQYQRLFSDAAVGQHFFRPVNLRAAKIGLWYGLLPRVQGNVLVPAIAAVFTYGFTASFAVDPELAVSRYGPPSASEQAELVDRARTAFGQPVPLTEADRPQR